MSSAAIVAAPPDMSETSALHIVSPDALEAGPVALAVRHWGELKGKRRFPARDDISPRDMAPFLRNIVMIRIIDGGKDYEYRIVGDAHVQAQGINFAGHTLSAIEAINSDYGTNTRTAYDYVRATAEPIAMRGWVGRDRPQSAYSYYETAFLPLGQNDIVDHLLVVTNYRPRAGQEFEPAVRLPKN